MAKQFTLPEGFSRDFSATERPCIGVFGPGYAGKTRFCTSAGEWAEQHGTIPGWIICDRKTQQTVEETCNLMGLPVPVMNKEPFLSSKQALLLASCDDEDTTKKAYSEAFDAVTKGLMSLATHPGIDPLIIDSGTELWDWIGYARLGRREGVKARYWGPSKRDWKDLFDALRQKTILITFWAKAEWKDDKMTNKTVIDGPPHVSYTTTTLLRLRKDERKEDPNERYALDVVESIDNTGLSGAENVLTGEEITFANLMMRLRPED
jgi:hypothetical protein